jgi:actin-related protein 9
LFIDVAFSSFALATMGFREENVVVIEVGSSTTRAVVGLNESMTPPQVRVATKIGVKRKRESSAPDNQNPAQPEYLFAEELEEGIKVKDPDLDVITPVVGGIITDWEAIEIFW